MTEQPRQSAMAGYFHLPGADATACLIYSALLLLWALAAETTAGNVVWALLALIPFYHALRSWNGPGQVAKVKDNRPVTTRQVIYVVPLALLYIAAIILSGDDRIPDLGVPGWATSTFLVSYFLLVLPIMFWGVPWRRDKESNGTAFS